MSKLFFKLADQHPELEAVSQNLSITTLRFVPLITKKHSENSDLYLNKLNEALLDELQKGGELFLSNAIVAGSYCLRTCIVNFRTAKKDIVESVGIIVKEGRKMHKWLSEN